MTTPARERVLAETLVLLADTLVVGYDLVELLHTLVERCADIVGAADAGILLADPDGYLEVVAATSEAARVVELRQIRGVGGPSLEAYASGRVATVADVADVEERWPDVARAARDAGYARIDSVPMRLRAESIGALTLYRATLAPLDAADLTAAQALADVATIGILHERAFREADLTRRQLQRALESRVVIEQAKGIIAQTHDLGVDAAFALLRAHARSAGERLHDVARDVVERRRDL